MANEERPAVSNHSQVLRGGGGGFISGLIKKLIMLAVLGAIGYGGYWYYTNNKATVHGWFGDRQQTAEDISNTSTAQEHRRDIESQLAD